MENSSEPFDPLTGNQSLFDNPELSDVRFLIDDQTVYGHKQTLAMGSPVFKSMFFGDLKEDREVIEIKDLSSTGFMNALSYVYGIEINYEFTELYETYMAADKYLLHGFNGVFFGYIKDNLTSESSCLIYDQMMKIGEREELPLADVRTRIIEGGEATFQNDLFPLIDQETLISLLSLDELRIAEIDLLAAVFKWVDCEVERQGLFVTRENRQKVFEPIKGYIVFTALMLDQIAKCEEVAELLTKEERGALALHLLDKSNPSIIDLKTQRKAGASVYSVLVSEPLVASGKTLSKETVLGVNRKVSIRMISTTYPERATNLNFTILNPKGQIELSSSFYYYKNIVKSVKDGRWCLSFDPFVVQPNDTYTLQITGNDVFSNDDQLSRQRQLKYEDSVTFSLSDYHCVMGLEFQLSD